MPTADLKVYFHCVWLWKRATYSVLWNVLHKLCYLQKQPFRYMTKCQKPKLISVHLKTCDANRDLIVGHLVRNFNLLQKLKPYFV
jgi:hypothetical protein